jgi:hypothetical protein
MSSGMKPVENAYSGKSICPICYIAVVNNLGEHIRNRHGEGEFRRAVLEAKERGMPDPEIGSRFGITFKQLERIITETYGINISTLEKPKGIKYWAPKDFREETTTVFGIR